MFSRESNSELVTVKIESPRESKRKDKSPEASEDERPKDQE